MIPAFIEWKLQAQAAEGQDTPYKATLHKICLSLGSPRLLKQA